MKYPIYLKSEFGTYYYKQVSERHGVCISNDGLELDFNPMPKQNGILRLVPSTREEVEAKFKEAVRLLTLQMFPIEMDLDRNVTVGELEHLTK